MSFAPHDNGFVHPPEVYVSLIFPMHDVQDAFRMPLEAPKEVSVLTSWFLSPSGNGAELTTFGWGRWPELAASRYLQHLLQYAHYDSFSLDDGIDNFTAILQAHFMKSRPAADEDDLDISNTDAVRSTLIGPLTRAVESENRTGNFKPISHLAHVFIIPISAGYMGNIHSSQRPQRQLVSFRWASASAKDEEVIESSVWKPSLHEALIDGWRKNVERDFSIEFCERPRTV
jgi:hypothetical protein